VANLLGGTVFCLLEDLQCREVLADDVPGIDVGWICCGALNSRLHYVGCLNLEIRLDHRTNRIVKQGKFVRFPAVKIRVPVPGRMSAGTARAEHEKVRIWSPSGIDNAAALVAFRRTEIARCNELAGRVANVDARFVQRRRKFTDFSYACSQLMVRRISSLATEICRLRRLGRTGADYDCSEERNRRSGDFHRFVILHTVDGEWQTKSRETHATPPAPYVGGPSRLCRCSLSA